MICGEKLGLGPQYNTIIYKPRQSVKNGGRLVEPKDNDSMEWKDWFVRHRFGPMVAMSIKTAQVKDLDILIDFAREIRNEKRQESD